MMDMKTSYAGLTLRNPIIIGSSGLTNKAERNLEFEKAGAGAIVLKSLFEEQIEMQSASMLQEKDYPEAADYIRSYVEANQVNDYLALIRQSKELCTIPIIASINCYKAAAWTNFAQQIAQAGADALELNVFFMETDLHDSAEAVKETYVTILRQVKEAIRIPVIMKIGKQYSNIPSLVHALKANGADGVVLFNRFYQPDIDVEKLTQSIGHVLSNEADLAKSLRWTGIASAAVSGVDYAVSGGVHTPDAVVNVITTIREVIGNTGRIITVVGAGGDRDKGKRPIMAREAAKLSDRLILTSDNPRSEEPRSILADMEAGLDTKQLKQKTLTVTDRREAIRVATVLAQRGDVVLVAGKGHETYQEVCGVRHHFDDREVLKEIFALE